MSYTEWGYIGYGIDLDDLSEEYIDLGKLQDIFKNNKYKVNDIFKLKSEDIDQILKTKSVQELLNLKPLKEYEDNETGYYSYNPLVQIVALILNQDNYGFEAALEDEYLKYVYLPACMPWEMGNNKNLTSKKFESFVRMALEEIYQEEYYSKIPEVEYVNCITGG